MKEKRDTSGLYDRIVMLSKIKYGSVNKMLKACDLNKSTVDNIKNGSMPSSDKLSAIAGVLDVSTDYLISGNDPNGGLVFTIDKEKFSESMSAISKKIQEGIAIEDSKKEPSPSNDKWERLKIILNDMPDDKVDDLIKIAEALREK